MTTFITKVCEAWTEMNTGDRAGTLTGPGRGLIITQLTHSNVMDAPLRLRLSGPVTTLSQISSTETLSSQWHGIKRLLVMLCHCGSSFGKSNYPICQKRWCDGNLDCVSARLSQHVLPPPACSTETWSPIEKFLPNTRQILTNIRNRKDLARGDSYIIIKMPLSSGG